ncbi:MAG: hypothetical protein ABR924_11405 [Terracidiphilus sp.]
MFFEISVYRQNWIATDRAIPLAWEFILRPESFCADSAWVPHPRRVTVFAATAVPQLLHPETTALKWHFPQENATLLNAGKGT